MRQMERNKKSESGEERERGSGGGGGAMYLFSHIVHLYSSNVPPLESLLFKS